MVTPTPHPVAPPNEAPAEQTSPARRGGWMLPTTLVVVGIVYLLLVHLPGRKQLNQLAASLKQQRQYITQAGDLRAAIEQTREQLARAEAQWQQWNDAAPSDTDLSPLFEMVHEQIKAAGAVPTRFDPADAIEMRRLRRTPVAMGVTGSFEQVFTMVQNLERLSPTLWIEELRIDGPKPGELACSCEARLVVYSSKMVKLQSPGQDGALLPTIGKILVRSILPTSDN